VSDTYIARRFCRKRKPPDVYGARRKITRFFSRCVSAAENKLIFSLVQMECRVNNESADVVTPVLMRSSFNGKAIGERPYGLSVTCLRSAGSAMTTMTTIAKRERHRALRRDSSFLPGFAYHFTYLSFLSKFSDDVCCVSIMLARNIEQGGRENSEIKYRDWGFGSRCRKRIDSRTRFYAWNYNKPILRTSDLDIVIELLYFDKKNRQKIYFFW